MASLLAQKPKVEVLPEESLLLDDFTLTANVGNSAGTFETVATHLVPRGEARKLVRQPGVLTFGTKDTFTGNGVLVTFALTRDAVKSVMFPLGARAYVGGVETPYTTTTPPPAGTFTVDFVANTVTFGTAPPAAANNTEVFYPFGEGKFTVEVFSANERRHETYANGSILRLNSAPQSNVNSAFYINSETPWIPQDYPIRLQVASPAIVSWDVRNPFSNIVLPYSRKPLTAMTAQEIEVAKMLIGA